MRSRGSRCATSSADKPAGKSGGKLIGASSLWAPQGPWASTKDSSKEVPGCFASCVSPMPPLAAAASIPVPACPGSRSSAAGSAVLAASSARRSLLMWTLRIPSSSPSSASGAARRDSKLVRPCSMHGVRNWPNRSGPKKFARVVGNSVGGLPGDAPGELALDSPALMAAGSFPVSRARCRARATRRSSMASSANWRCTARRWACSASQRGQDATSGAQPFLIPREFRSTFLSRTSG
mmetsp:Transcript_31846/g.71678  ORF Transcript_31846/g.71678 Transcript_31846/m.71678 type:complete len:237 (+) Transcript_31846:507-1217(+)